MQRAGTTEKKVRRGTVCHRTVAVVVVGFWLVMMGSLVRRWLVEVRPEMMPGTYRSALAGDRRNYHSRMAIILPRSGKRVGYTETVFLCTSDRKYRITNSTRVEAAVTGLLQHLAPFDLDTMVLVGSDYALEYFLVTLTARGVHATLTGEVRGKELVLRGRVEGLGEQVHRVALPPGGLVATGLSPLLALPPLRVGLRWSAMVFNPLTLQPTRVDIEVLRREWLRWSGRMWRTHVVEIRSGLLQARAWVSENGEVLQERSLFGLLFVKEVAPQEAEPFPGDGQGEGGS